MTGEQRKVLEDTAQKLTGVADLQTLTDSELETLVNTYME